MQHTTIILSLLLLAGSAHAEEKFNAKSLFFGENDSVIAVSTSQKSASSAPVVSATNTTKKPATVVASKKHTTPANIGASYFIRLKNPDGSTNDVLANRKFKSGERFQLGVKVNVPSYVYIFNENPNGKVTQIYPQSGHTNFVDAMGVVFLPNQGSFEFDNVPGTEQLLVYLSQKPIDSGVTERVKGKKPDIVSAVADASDSTCMRTTGGTLAPYNSSTELASKDSKYSEDSNCADKASGSSNSYASRGIFFSEDPTPAPGGQVASYVVKLKNTVDADLFLKIKLVHQ